MSDNEDLIKEEAECGRFYLTGDIDEDIRHTFVPLLRQRIANLGEDDSIEIFIDCFGGDGYVMLDIIALMEKAKRQGIPVKTIIPANANSAGSFIAVAGTKGERYIGEYAEHLVHYGSVQPHVITNPTELARDNQRWQRWHNTALSLYGKYCKIPGLSNKLKDDYLWIPAEDAIKYKMADKLLEEW